MFGNGILRNLWKGSFVAIVRTLSSLFPKRACTRHSTKCIIQSRSFFSCVICYLFCVIFCGILVPLSWPELINSKLESSAVCFNIGVKNNYMEDSGSVTIK